MDSPSSGIWSRSPSRRARTTVTLSSPPRELARAIISLQAAARVGAVSMSTRISSASSLLERPSEQSSSTSPLRRSRRPRATSTSGRCPIAWSTMFFMGNFAAASGLRAPLSIMNWTKL